MTTREHKVIEPSNGSRTHEPSLRELTAELDGLRLLLLEKVAHVIAVLDERDRLYSERDNSRRTAVDAALSAQKEQTASSFQASEKAIVKAESAQQSYNERSNEFRGQLDDQAKRLISRLEVESMVKNVEEKIGRLDVDLRSLRESRSEMGGRGQGAYLLWTIFAGLIAVGATLYAMLK